MRTATKNDGGNSHRQAILSFAPEFFVCSPSQRHTDDPFGAGPNQVKQTGHWQHDNDHQKRYPAEKWRAHPIPQRMTFKAPKASSRLLKNRGQAPISLT
jgi:hypothetical protein